jgi:hypothetical protein
MDDLVKEIIPLLQYLIPGFLSAWVFYSLTAFKRPGSSIHLRRSSDRIRLVRSCRR